MSRAFLLGIDVGTTSTKVSLCDLDGKVIAEVSEEQHLESRHSGWSEEDPNQWWENAVRGIQRNLAVSKVDPSEIKGIGVTGMVPAMVLLNQGVPLRPSIQQNDARAWKEIEWMKTELDERWVFERTGGSINQQTLGPKLKWLEKHEPNTFSRIQAIVGSYDYVNYRLSGTLSLEANWALESGLYDIAKRDWIDELLKLLNIEREQLPQVYQPHEIVSYVSRHASQLTGLCEGTPIVAGCADHVASAVMADIREEGDVLIKLGSAGDILFCVDTLDTDPRLFIDYHTIPGKYLINGCMATSGSIVTWFVNEFCGSEAEEAKRRQESAFEAMDKRVEDLPPGSTDLILLPYFLGEKTPLMDPLARGVLFGLSLHHRKEHVYKAILEAVSYGFQHHIETLSEKGHKAKKIVVRNGGARSRLWARIAADIIGQDIYYISKHQGSALGAAFVAGMGVNCFSQWSDVQRFIHIDAVISPDPQRHVQYAKCFDLYKALYLDLKNRFVQLESLRNSQVSQKLSFS